MASDSLPGTEAGAVAQSTLLPSGAGPGSQEPGIELWHLRYCAVLAGELHFGPAAARPHITGDAFGGVRRASRFGGSLCWHADRGLCAAAWAVRGAAGSGAGRWQTLRPHVEEGVALAGWPPIAKSR